MTKPVYILLHGAWHASWCWKSIVPLLAVNNVLVQAPDLPGRGKNFALFSEITLQAYVDSVMQLVQQQAVPVILVGHSMAGVIISQVAENLPESIQCLVYVAAFIPPSGVSLAQEARKTACPTIAAEMVPDRVQQTVALRHSPRLKKLFYNASPAAEAELALSLLQKEPLRPFTDPVILSAEKFGRVPKTFLVCDQDNLLLPADQQRMAVQAGCRVWHLEAADHSPFFSAPEVLVNALLKAGSLS